MIEFDILTLFPGLCEGAFSESILGKAQENRLIQERCLKKLLRSEEHTSELQSPDHLVCRLLLENKKNHETNINILARMTVKHVIIHPVLDDIINTIMFFF